MNTILKTTEKNMQKALEAFKQDLGKLRTGRAHASLVEGVKVDYYGAETQLKHIANIVASDARTITVTPWEKNMLKAVEKAIASADLGLNPVTDSNVIRVPIPQLTAERRKDLVKVVKSTAEQARVSVRNLRRDANTDLKKLSITEDEERRAQESVQKLTDHYIAEIDTIVAHKEKDLLEIL